MTYLNREEAAAYLGCEPSTLGKWASRGIGPAYFRRGRRTHYLRTDLDNWRDTYQRRNPAQECA